MDLSVKAIHDIVHPTAVLSAARGNSRHPARHPKTGGSTHPGVVADRFHHLHLTPHGGGTDDQIRPKEEALADLDHRCCWRDEDDDAELATESVPVCSPKPDLYPDVDAADMDAGTCEYEDDVDADTDLVQDPAMGATASWMQSQLNPKNRIDSLDPPKDAMWRVDGCTGLGTQFYVIPLFLDPAPPMRVDVFIPEHAEQSPHIRGLLDLATAFHTKDAVRVSKLGISNYIIRALHLWSKSFADFPVMYRSLPFGSRVIFESLPLDLRDIRIQVAHTYNLERQMLSLHSLASLWAIPDPAHSPFFPDRVDLFSLEVLEQVHDSTSIVRHKDELLIFKAITSHTKYIYHELYNLLNVRPHPNIVSRPRHLVTKKCRFGSKTAVVGFTLEYHAPGTLRDIVPVRRLNGRLSAADQLRWAKQITSALLHLHKTGGPFYPDLRLDNVVLTTGDDAVMVDFEQRGVWCEFGPPEINALEYVRLLATDKEAAAESDASSAALSVPPSLRGSELDIDDEPPRSQGGSQGVGAEDWSPNRGCGSLFSPERYVQLLGRLLPGYEALLAREDYTEAGVRSGGYNIAWLSLSPREREAAEVYMLGRVLYCIFEGVAAPNRAAVWQSYRWESDVEFPQHLRAPKRVSGLVDKCTLGRRRSLTSRLRRVGDKMTLVREDGSVDEEMGGGACGVERIQDVATTFWKGEVEHAVEFLEDRLAAMKVGTWNQNYFGRPSLKEVLAELEDISRELGVC